MNKQHRLWSSQQTGETEGDVPTASLPVSYILLAHGSQDARRQQEDEDDEEADEELRE